MEQNKIKTHRRKKEHSERGGEKEEVQQLLWRREQVTRTTATEIIYSDFCKVKHT